jgi:hypothetical protein
MKHPLLIGAALLALTALPVVAQGDCPALGTTAFLSVGTPSKSIRQTDSCSSS